MKQISDKTVAVMTRIETTAKKQDANNGTNYWNNKNSVYREANEAFVNDDTERLERVWKEYFC